MLKYVLNIKIFLCIIKCKAISIYNYILIQYCIYSQITIIDDMYYLLHTGLHKDIVQISKHVSTAILSKSDLFHLDLFKVSVMKLCLQIILENFTVITVS